ncbi:MULTISPECIES: NADH-quinone oxidoreductase subunit C [unclassified Ornithinimicrobium]|uniref:NADH-quinone oxidoreductase subunit C n=1 Tax=unclassified Ornithinimicrobium TaxID=2615080 RepID=UPI003851A1AA
MNEPELVERRVPPQEWSDAVRAALDEGFAFFDWLSAVDETDSEDEHGPGLDVVCHLMDVRGAGHGRGVRRVLLQTRVPVGTALASVTAIFPGAGWHERETHEMFGLELDGFEDGTGLGVRPLLLPEGFEGTPLRKSFQLAARASKPWPGAKEPGEGSSAKRSPSRRRLLPPGVPDPSWGPRADSTAVDGPRV